MVVNMRLCFAAVTVAAFYWHHLRHMLYQRIYMLYFIWNNESFSEGQHCKRYIFIVVFIAVANGSLWHMVIIVFSLILVLLLDACWSSEMCFDMSISHNSRLGVICGYSGKLRWDDIFMRVLCSSYPDFVARGILQNEC